MSLSQDKKLHMNLNCDLESDLASQKKYFASQE